MKMLTKTQVKVILILLDNKGHPGWELAEYLEMEASNLNPKLKKLEEDGIIFKGESRLSKRPHKKKGNYEEDPYYLSRNIDSFRILIKEISNTRRLYDSGFVLDVIKKSKYIKFMREIFKGDPGINIDNELHSSYPPLSDMFFVNIIEPELENPYLSRYLIRKTIPEIENWYNEYLRIRRTRKPKQVKP